MSQVEYNVVTPEEMGTTIKLQGAKYNVNLKANGGIEKNGSGELSVKVDDFKTELPKVTGATLSGNTLTIALENQDTPNVSVDLSDLIPTFDDQFLQSAVVSGTNLVLTFKGSVAPINVDLTSLLPVQAKGGIKGDGTTGKELGLNLADNSGLEIADEKVKLKVPAGKGLVLNSNGLEFDKANLVKLKNATGTKTLGYIIA